MPNRDVQMTLEEAVSEVLSSLVGLDLTYDPDQDRFQSVTRFINRALRQVALEHDWSYYASTEEVGIARAGLQTIELSARLRPRVINDDAVRLVDDNNVTQVWAYFLPRDAIFKYGARSGLWASVTRTTITFSRKLSLAEDGLHIVVPVMREPLMFRLPPDNEPVPAPVLRQLVDFDYPDLIVAKASELYAATDPVMQPRVQTLEAKYKDLMYQLIERDERATDAPYVNEFLVPIQCDLEGRPGPATHGHPHADERWY